MKNKKEIIKKKYEEIAKNNFGCSCCKNNEMDVSRFIGYTSDEITKGEGANLGLGCGNPIALSDIKKGDVVLDLGSGAGFDCFLAAEKVGKGGKVIGIDMTEKMIEKAKENAEKRKLKNVEFILSEIEDIPLSENSVDIIISNCVINLSLEKEKVFKEAYRVLKNDGRIYLSDIVLLEELSEEEKNNDDLIVGCVAGAMLKDEYLKIIKNSGFQVEILLENKEISKKQYQGKPIQSITIKATKKL